MTETNRFAPFPSLQAEADPGFCFVVSVVNLAQIERVHGQLFARHVLRVVRDRTRALSRTYAGTVASSGTHLLCVFGAVERQPLFPQNPAFPLAVLRLLAGVGDRPVALGTAAAFPVVDVAIAQCDGQPLDIDGVGSSRVLRDPAGERWREHFVADTQVAEAVFASMESGRLGFAFEPVCSAAGNGAVRYREALLCNADGTGRPLEHIGSRVASLERIGMVRRLDRWVFESIVDRLFADSRDQLGCNLSAQSATLDAWWAAAFSVLDANPSVARRLTVEITETWAIDDLASVQAFCRVLRSFGCRIALDDVDDRRCGSLEQLGLDVDVVKIDRSAVQDARSGAPGRARLKEIVRIAKEYSPIVVVEGIETDRDRQVARECGATHLQGYLFAG